MGKGRKPKKIIVVLTKKGGITSDPLIQKGSIKIIVTKEST